MVEDGTKRGKEKRGGQRDEEEGREGRQGKP